MGNGTDGNGGAITWLPTPAPRQPAARVVELRVVFSVSAFTPASVAVEAEPVTIGREPPAGPGALKLDDRRVSRVHAIVSRTADGYVVADQQSRNGLRVDGARRDSAPLAHGSVIRVGATLLMFLDHDPRSGDSPGKGELLGPSTQMRRVRAEARLAASQPLPVLITGETGAGKERVAREIHRLAGRSGAFVALNCAALTAALAESELFGHTAGAFTGASRSSPGVFEAARGGTLLLDEIGEMPLELQPKLLRALALGEVRAVGSSDARTIDVRVVAATNRDLAVECEAGRFRPDLLARLSGWRIVVPPLRERREDILPLAKAALGAYPALRLSGDAAEALLLHDWPFNVRELQQAIMSAAVRATADQTETIAAAHLPEVLAARVGELGPFDDPEEPSEPSAGDIAGAPGAPTPDELRDALAASGHNISEVARRFGKGRRQIYRWLERYGIALPGKG